MSNGGKAPTAGSKTTGGAAGSPVNAFGGAVNTGGQSQGGVAGAGGAQAGQSGAGRGGTAGGSGASQGGGGGKGGTGGATQGGAGGKGGGGGQAGGSSGTGSAGSAGSSNLECLDDWKGGACDTCSTQTQSDKLACVKILDCYAANACGPATCANNDEKCGANKIGQGTAGYPIAKTVYDCACQ